MTNKVHPAKADHDAYAKTAKALFSGDNPDKEMMSGLTANDHDGSSTGAQNSTAHLDSGDMENMMQTNPKASDVLDHTIEHAAKAGENSHKSSNATAADEYQSAWAKSDS